MGGWWSLSRGTFPILSTWGGRASRSTIRTITPSTSDSERLFFVSITLGFVNMVMLHLIIRGVVKQIFNLINNQTWFDPCNCSNFPLKKNRFFRELSQLTRLTGTARRDPVSRTMPACDSRKKGILLFLQPVRCLRSSQCSCQT